MSIEKPKDNIEWAMKILIEKLQELGIDIKNSKKEKSPQYIFTI